MTKPIISGVPEVEPPPPPPPSMKDFEDAVSDFAERDVEVMNAKADIKDFEKMKFKDFTFEKLNLDFDDALKGAMKAQLDAKLAKALAAKDEALLEVFQIAAYLDSVKDVEPEVVDLTDTAKAAA